MSILSWRSSYSKKYGFTKTDNKLMKLSNFSRHRVDYPVPQQKRGGGVSVYVSNQWYPDVRSISEYSDVHFNSCH